MASARARNENTTSTTVPLKLLVDEKKRRVIAAEATSDFVDALLSFLTLPMGTIVRVTNQHPGSIGCFNNLYQSIQQLSANNFSTEASKSMLLSPRNPCVHFCKKLKLNLDTSNGNSYYCRYQRCGRWSHYIDTPCPCGHGDKTEGKDSNEKKFVKSEMTFVITDDLRVQTGCPTSLLQLLHEFNFVDVQRIVEISVDVGLDKVTELLKRSLLSKTPLTDVFVERQDHDVTNIAPSHINFVKTENEMTSVESKKLNIKLLTREMDKEILAVEADESFVDFLFSLCTIPLGSLIKLLDGESRLGCVDVLYKTVESMDPNFLNILKKEIMDCGVLEQYKCNSMLLQVTISSNDRYFIDPRSPYPRTECFGKFLKDNQLFIISNNLIVKSASSVSSISFLKELNVRADDVKVIEVAIGGNEALALMKASLISPSVIDALKIFLEDKKSQFS